MTNDELTPFGDLLREYREAAGLTQEELAERADVSVRTISDIERGITVRSHKYTIRGIAKALKLGPSERAKLHVAASSVSTSSRAKAGSAGGITNRAHGHDTDTNVQVAHNQLRSAQTISNRMRGAIATATAVIVLIVLLAVVLFLFSDKRILAQSSALQVVGGSAGVQFRPVTKTSDGLLFVEAGQPVTISFTVRNTDPSGIRIGKMWALAASVRGPDACNRGWAASNQDFPPVLEGIVLLPGEEYRYEQTRSFDVPGVYFVEPAKQGADGKWGGIQPFPRIYFMMVDKETGRFPNSECMTPVPIPPATP